MAANRGLLEFHGQLCYVADHVAGGEERTNNGYVPGLLTDAAASMQARSTASKDVLTVPE